MTTLLYTKLPIVNTSQLFETHQYEHLVTKDKQTESKTVNKSKIIKPLTSMVFKDMDGSVTPKMAKQLLEKPYDAFSTQIRIKNQPNLWGTESKPFNIHTNFEKILLLKKKLMLSIYLLLYNIWYGTPAYHFQQYFSNSVTRIPLARLCEKKRSATLPLNINVVFDITEHTVFATSPRELLIRNVPGLLPFYLGMLTNTEQGNSISKIIQSNSKNSISHVLAKQESSVSQVTKPSQILDIAITSKFSPSNINTKLNNLKRSNVIKIVPLSINSTIDPLNTRNLSYFKKKIKENYEITSSIKKIFYSVYNIGNSPICNKAIAMLTGPLNNDYIGSDKIYAGIKSSLYSIYNNDEINYFNQPTNVISRTSKKTAYCGTLLDLVRLSSTSEWITRSVKTNNLNSVAYRGTSDRYENINFFYKNSKIKNSLLGSVVTSDHQHRFENLLVNKLRGKQDSEIFKLSSLSNKFTAPQTSIFSNYYTMFLPLKNVTSFSSSINLRQKNTVLCLTENQSTPTQKSSPINILSIWGNNHEINKKIDNIVYGNSNFIDVNHLKGKLINPLTIRAICEKHSRDSIFEIPLVESSDYYTVLPSKNTTLTVTNIVNNIDTLNQSVSLVPSRSLPHKKYAEQQQFYNKSELTKKETTIRNGNEVRFLLPNTTKLDVSQLQKK